MKWSTVKPRHYREHIQRYARLSQVKSNLSEQKTN